jgi:hypothetical protein
MAISNKQIRVNPPKGEKDQFVTLTTQDRVFEKYRIVDQTELETDLKPDVVYALVCQKQRLVYN